MCELSLDPRLENSYEIGNLNVDQVLLNSIISILNFPSFITLLWLYERNSYFLGGTY